MTKIIGYIGAFLLAFCGFPAMVDVVQKGTAEGYSTIFLLMWGFGELLTAYYVYKQHGLDKPLMFNYGFNLAFISVICYYILYYFVEV